MTTRTSSFFHFDPDDIGHHHYPDSYSTLEIGEGGDNALTLFFHAPADIDAVMAELAALRAEMTGEADDAWKLTPKGIAATDAVRSPLGRCTASTYLDDEHVTLYCDREHGHCGSHHAPGPDEGSEVAWSDETVGNRA